MLVADMSERATAVASTTHVVQRVAERRQSLRDDVTLPASVVAVESPKFNAQTINISRGGFFLAAAGTFKVVVQVGGATYRCRLVRVTDMREGVTGCAVKIEEELRPSNVDSEADAVQLTATAVPSASPSLLARAWRAVVGWRRQGG